MMKVFLDTNILLDFVDNREKREYAETIIELGRQGVIELYASYLSYVTGGQEPVLRVFLSPVSFYCRCLCDSNPSLCHLHPRP